MKRAATNALKEIDARNLQISNELRAQIVATCHDPDTGADVFLERFLRGGEVIDARGGPDAVSGRLWDAWHALLLAYQACWNEQRRRRKATKTRMRRLYQDAITNPESRF